MDKVTSANFVKRHHVPVVCDQAFWILLPSFCQKICWHHLVISQSILHLCHFLSLTWDPILNVLNCPCVFTVRKIRSLAYFSCCSLRLRFFFFPLMSTRLHVIDTNVITDGDWWTLNITCLDKSLSVYIIIIFVCFYSEFHLSNSSSSCFCLVCYQCWLIQRFMILCASTQRSWLNKSFVPSFCNMNHSPHAQTWNYSREIIICVFTPYCQPLSMQSLFT